MKIVKKISEIKEIVSNFKKNKKEINLIPTMGNIHAGHLSLLSEANTFDGINIVSIFVNPTQFNDEDDFNNYPNTFEADMEILSKTNCNHDRTDLTATAHQTHANTVALSNNWPIILNNP